MDKKKKYDVPFFVNKTCHYVIIGGLLLYERCKTLPLFENNGNGYIASLLHSFSVYFQLRHSQGL